MRERLSYLCALGHLAPSTHNVQPWRFFIDPGEQTITLCVDTAAILPASDASGRQTVISLGCCLENIASAANYYGWQHTLTYSLPSAAELASSTRKKLIPIAALHLEDKIPAPTERPSNSPLINNILDRKVIRAEFSNQKNIPPDVMNKLTHLNTDTSLTFHLVTDYARKLTVAEFQGQADGYVINSPKFSRELGDWLLPNDTKSYVGMPGIGFGLTDIQALRLHQGLSGVSTLEPEDGLRFATASKIGIEKAPLLGFITATSDTPESWLATGRLLEKIFLLLTEERISFAVHAGITEVPLIKKIFGLTLGTLQPITALFRAGYVKNEADLERPHSPRLPLNEVLLSEKP